jgi:ectoine hydroxylase-related dioxygenase (phytanoyl-CoA dioxygenase family)
VVLILLDDFAEENGATWFLPGSHNREESPSEDEFYSKAERLVASAGSAWYFDPRLWHAADTNGTDSWRHSFGFNMCRPYMKQRFDIPRLLAGVDIEGVSENARQKLGFYAQAPTTLDEYYAPLHQRMFRQPYE